MRLFRKCMMPAGAAALLVASLSAASGQVIKLPAPPPSSRPAESSGPVSASGPVRNGLMWKATSATGTAYLVGSIHYGTEQLYPLPQAVEDAFLNSNVLVVEIDARKLKDPAALLPLISSIGLYPPGDSLWNHVSTETHDLVSAFCQQNSLSEDMLGRLKPWMAAFTVLGLQLKTLGVQPELGLDMHFLNQSEGKEVRQIETPEQQLRLLARMPEAELEKSLQEMLRDPEKNRVFIEDVQSAWLRGDGAAIDKMLQKEGRKMPGQYNELFGVRNVGMTSAVEHCLKGGQQCFIVVGAGHLVGKDGIVRMLEQRGVKVQQVTAK